MLYGPGVLTNEVRPTWLIHSGVILISSITCKILLISPWLGWVIRNISLIKTVIPPNLIENSQRTCNLYYTKREECYSVQSYCSSVDTQNTPSRRESTLLHSFFFLSIDMFKQKIAYTIFGSYLCWIAID